MTLAATITVMPELLRPCPKVRWRNPEKARACGWEAVFGPGPYAVLRAVDHSAHGLARGLVLCTAVGEHEIPEVWLVAADQPRCDGDAPAAVTAGAPAVP
jgi:hypothetical protein